jgi:putative ABC transport system permease protein
LAALRDDPGSDDGSSTRFRLVVGTLLAVVGVVAVVDGLFGRGGNRGQISGVGVAAVFLAVSAFGPVIARPLAGAIGRPFAAAFKLPGRLARENAMRHPRRTASTAAALMIGLALVTIVAVFSQTIKTSLATALDDGLTAQGVVSPTNIASSGFTTAVAATLAADRHFTDVTGLAQGAATLEGAGPRGGGGGHLTAKRLEHGHLLGGGSPKGPARVHVLGVDVPAYVNDIRLSVKAGSLAHLGTGDVAVSSAFASSHHLAVGDGVTLTFPTSGTRRLRIGAVFVDPTTVSGDLLVTTATFDQVYPITQLDEAVILRWAPGLSDAQGTTALTRALKPFPQVKGQDRAGYIASQQQSLDQLVALVTALLALAIVIALFGIVNTLALSILERTREIGLLRILGMSRRQLRSMVRWESVVIALLGCVLGMVIGLGFGWVLVRSLRSQGLTQFAVPWSLLAVIVVLAGLSGVVAAVLPAHRAVRIDVLEAIAAD